MGEGVTAYREFTFAPEIARELTEAGFLGAPDSNRPQGLCLDERVLEAAGFHSFASFRTNREKFRCVACVLFKNQESGRSSAFEPAGSHRGKTEYWVSQLDTEHSLYACG